MFTWSDDKKKGGAKFSRRFELIIQLELGQGQGQPCRGGGLRPTDRPTAGEQGQEAAEKTGRTGSLLIVPGLHSCAMM